VLGAARAPPTPSKPEPHRPLAKRGGGLPLDRPDHSVPRRSPSRLQRARDEAHRFGVAYSRKRRSQRTITSELLDIPGVGPLKRTRLLERFGSLAAVRTASAAELAAVPGFSTTLAERVLAALRSRT
jgi:excinuclease ABC subunit C